jgi:hypothetical protein
MAGQWNPGTEPPGADSDRQEAPGWRPHEHKTEDELIDMLEEIILELKARREITTLLFTEIPRPEFSSAQSTAEANSFVKLPKSASDPRPEAAALAWRIVLHSSHDNHDPLNLEIHEDVIIGRTQDYIVPDLDLTEYDAQELGVSRQHALLHPTADSLELVDLLSANGTSVNQERLKKGEYRALKHDDVLSFGKLHFMLKIVDQPDSP